MFVEGTAGMHAVNLPHERSIIMAADCDVARVHRSIEPKPDRTGPCRAVPCRTGPLPRVSPRSASKTFTDLKAAKQGAPTCTDQRQVSTTFRFRHPRPSVPTVSGGYLRTRGTPTCSNFPPRESTFNRNRNAVLSYLFSRGALALRLSLKTSRESSNLPPLRE